MFTQEQIRKNLELSLQKAEEALLEGNYPIGSVVTDVENNIGAIEKNESFTSDIAAHAEIICLRKLGQRVNKYNGGEHFLFTSLEPCFGCSFFIARSNIKGVYSALKDPHKGGMSDLKRQDQFANFFKNIELINDPFEDLRERSRSIMRRFFESINNLDAAKYYE